MVASWLMASPFGLGQLGERTIDYGVETYLLYGFAKESVLDGFALFDVASYDVPTAWIPIFVKRSFHQEEQSVFNEDPAGQIDHEHIPGNALKSVSDKAPHSFAFSLSLRST
ncbi:hypothetical protein QTL95_16985 [Rhizobium sp. S152]|nr:hypothetical protein [Rhizobium sp. S152]MDM9627601.1 hypothetical protein [Rhizobium sp. S152]